MQAARANPAEHPEQRWGRGVGTPRVTHITLELILDKGLVKFIFTKGDKPNEKAVTFHFNSWLPDGSGGRGLEIVSNKPNFKLNDSLWNVNNRGIGFGSNGTVAGATVTIDSSIIQDSKKPENKTYENWSDQADTRGISLWNNKGLELNIIDNSAILGFGYPINMAGDIVDGVRDMADSVINITNSNIWGWCAMNIWTIDTTFNIKNSNLKGFVETDNAWNSFATIVLNEDIYKGVTDSSKANVFLVGLFPRPAFPMSRKCIIACSGWTKSSCPSLILHKQIGRKLLLPAPIRSVLF